LLSDLHNLIKFTSITYFILKYIIILKKVFMNKKSATIYDISKKLNVSVATVSRALNDHPRISEATKELVRKTAKEMNYKQNNLAKALKSGETKNVGIIVPYINTNFFSSVIRGIEEELSPFGYHVIICQSHEDVIIEKKHLNTLLNAQVDGIFMSVSRTTVDTEHIQNILDTSNTPIIFFDRKKDPFLSLWPCVIGRSCLCPHEEGRACSYPSENWDSP